MKKINIYISLIASVALLMHACMDFDEPDTNLYEGETVTLALDFFMDEEGQEVPYSDTEGTRAPDGVIDNAVNDVWIMQFNGTDDNSILLIEPQYISSVTSSTKATFAATSSANRIVAIANTGSPDHPWKATVNKTTFSDIFNAFKMLNSEKETYFGNHIMMAGWQDVNISSAPSLDIPLKRSYAKVEFTLKNLSSTVTINKAILFNVPLKVDFFAPYHDHTGEIYPVDEEEYGSFPLNNITDLGPGDTKKFTWYTPTNIKGTTNNSQTQHKNFDAPSKASCIKLYGVDSQDNSAIVYTLYPGANMINDFNLKADTRYNLTINLPASGGNSLADSRVDTYKINDMKDKIANSYILNLPYEDGLERIYRIYPKQVNTYFGENGYKESGVAAIDIAGIPQSWRVEVVWMAYSNMVTRTEADGNITLTEKADAKGEDDYFEIKVPITAKQGNFVVGLYKDINTNGKHDNEEPYRWSWHFWVTDYNPDMVANIVNTGDFQTSQYIYNVPGGKVFRLDGEQWRSGIYKQSVMMDRNMGAHQPLVNGERGEVVKTDGNLLYQWGRKEPIPYYRYIYDESGNYTSSSDNFSTITGGPSTEIQLEDAFAYPKHYIHNNSAPYDWTKDPDQGLYLWKDKRIEGTEDQLKLSTKKSLYDPCPYGWQLPSPLAWEDLEIGRTVFNDARSLGFISSNIKHGMPYWPGNASSPVDGEIIFQNYGYRSGSSASFNTSIGGYHTSVPANESQAYMFRLSETSMAIGSEFNSVNRNYRVYAFSVRCVKMEVQP